MKRIFLLLPLLAACSGGGVPIASDSRIESRYHLQDLSYIAAGSDLKTDVLGNPFTSDQATFAAVVADHLQGVNPGPEIHFTPTRRQRRENPISSGWRSTDRPPATARTLRHSTGSCAILCPERRRSGDRRLLPRGSADHLCVGKERRHHHMITAFRRLVRQVGLLLFPLRNPEDINNCIPPNC